ncbi:protein PIN-LIKES 3-like [Senna tora]|uniref:Protein PIN-LIKES 3-like n=1 Tax=Senna tora TaxID=362788 RepID=A0A834WNC9_9FABA|nr:protein PIN-LIKES 3-like [Senna tora]
MGFLQLLVVASFPVIKLLIITAIGLFLALDHIDILGASARNHLNDIVFYVLNPALVSSNLANTITFETFVSLWFMPVNILATFIVGSALGWIITKVTRTPKHLEGLILGCCSAGNLGNLLIIVVPAICKEKGSPFGDSDVCYNYGMAYASLSMAIGAIFIWSYVYNIMRISANQIPRASISSEQLSILRSSGALTEPFPELNLETDSPTKDATDDAYSMLVPSSESEIKVSFSERIKQYFRRMLTNLNLKAIFAPATLGAIGGFLVGIISPLRNLMIGSDAPLRVLEDSAIMLGDAAIPSITLVMGANLLRGLKGTGSLLWTIGGVIIVRYILLPIVGVLIVKGAVYIGAVPQDPLYQFMLLLQYALPPAMNIATIAQLFGAGESECSVIMLWTYVLASVAVTLWSTYFMLLVS